MLYLDRQEGLKSLITDWYELYDRFMVLLYKVRRDQMPAYLFKRISKKFGRNTRLASSGGINDDKIFSSTIGTQSFCPRAISYWNTLPPEIRTAPILKSFKGAVELWVKEI